MTTVSSQTSGQSTYESVSLTPYAHNRQTEDDNDDDDNDGDDRTVDAEEGEDVSQGGRRTPRRRRSRQSSSSPGNRAGAPHRPPRDYHHLRLKSKPTLPLLADPDVASTVREIGRTPSWILSTAKPGNGRPRVTVDASCTR